MKKYDIIYLLFPIMILILVGLNMINQQTLFVSNLKTVLAITAGVSFILTLLFTLFLIIGLQQDRKNKSTLIFTVFTSQVIGTYAIYFLYLRKEISQNKLV